MKHLASLNKYFAKYKWRLLAGILFVAISNVFAVRAPAVVRDTLDEVARMIPGYRDAATAALKSGIRREIFELVFWQGLVLIGLALLRGVFMFFMRQTLIVMSRHIEYDQKAELYRHYQELHATFYKTHFTGDLMNRMSEDVSRVRMYTGPAIMYSINLLVLAVLCIWQMLQQHVQLTLWVVAPLPFLAVSIYFVNRLIYSKSERIQAQLSGLTTTAQETYSGIRVIKSFVQEEASIRTFEETSEAYRKSAINLALTEAVYFPSMSLFIGLSMLSTVGIGGWLAIRGVVTPGNIAEFVIYLNLLMFPISSLGWVASMVQRAASSQKRINEFLHTLPEIVSPPGAVSRPLGGEVIFDNVSFTYPHTGIRALRQFSLHATPGQKIAIIGTTGSGKSTITQMMLRMYDIDGGSLRFDGTSVQQMDLHALRSQISYAPQEALLFSNTVYNNIRFGKENAGEAEVREAARLADLEKDIATLKDGYETVIGERGVMLSGGQKQRLVLARALLKDAPILVLDESLSAVDTRTEQTILQNLKAPLQGKTVFVITHRIFTGWRFDKILVLDDGAIAEQGTHEELMQLNGRYARLYLHQTGTGQ